MQKELVEGHSIEVYAMDPNADGIDDLIGDPYVPINSVAEQILCPNCQGSGWDWDWFHNNNKAVSRCNECKGAGRVWFGL